MTSSSSTESFTDQKFSEQAQLLDSTWNPASKDSKDPTLSATIKKCPHENVSNPPISKTLGGSEEEIGQIPVQFLFVSCQSLEFPLACSGCNPVPRIMFLQAACHNLLDDKARLVLCLC